MNMPMRYLGLCLGLSGCVPIQRSVVGRIYNYTVQCNDAARDFREIQMISGQLR